MFFTKVDDKFFINLDMVTAVKVVMSSKRGVVIRVHYGDVVDELPESFDTYASAIAYAKDVIGYKEQPKMLKTKPAAKGK